jgi:hypothetical protein
MQYKFNVEFLEPAIEFLESLERKSFILFVNQEVLMMPNYLKN